jgi:hypothetical protein
MDRDGDIHNIYIYIDMEILKWGTPKVIQILVIYMVELGTFWKTPTQ